MRKGPRGEKRPADVSGEGLLGSRCKHVARATISDSQKAAAAGGKRRGGP